MRHLTILLCALLTLAVQAGGIRPLVLPPVPATQRPLVIDGKLDDWTGIDGKVYRPFDVALVEGDAPELTKLRQWDLKCTVRFAYDDAALYLALAWTDPQPKLPEDRLAVHLRTDQIFHVHRDWTANGTAAVRLTAQTMTVRSPTQVTMSGKTYAFTRTAEELIEEFCLPWSVITETGKAPTDGRLAGMLDFAWSELPTEVQAKLPKELRRQHTHTTLSFLTAQDKLFTSGYLSQPAMWGDLRFITAPERSTIVSSPLDGTTGLTSLPASLVAKPPIIDGKVEDWPEIFATAAPANNFSKRYNADLALQYDAQNLYVAGRFSSPLVKPINLARENTQQGYGGGDALQIRLHNGPKTVNLCAWYNTLDGSPALTADGKDLKQPFLRTVGATVAFGVPKGGGYSLEVTIPWDALGLGTPKAGDVWKATFQPWWAGLEPEFSAQFETKLEKRGALAVRYELPKDGEVTLGLYDAAGKLLRWITRADYRYAGAQTEAWDGLDQWGVPLPAGTYTVRGLVRPPLKLEHKLTLGNPGTPPWPTPDGKGDWLSDESTPQAAVSDGKWVYLAAPGSEKGWSIIAVDEHGQRQWGLNEEFYPRCVSLALDGDHLYALFSGPELTDSSRGYFGKGNAIERAILLCVDKRTGKAVKFSRDKRHLKVATWPYREAITKLSTLRATHGFTPGVYGGQPRYFCNDLGESTSALGVAALNGQVYISLYFEDKLLVLDAETAKPVDEIPLPKPVGLHVAQGLLYAVSGTTVVRVDPAAKTATPVIKEGLLAPHSLTADAKGIFYVSDWGASFQVKLFSPEGKYLRAIGKAGGRPWVGKWESDGMLVPRGVAVTDDGKLWVAEDDATPKRVSVWDVKTGAFLRDYIGPTPYGGGATFWVDPKDSTLVNTMGVRFKVDWAKGSWTPLATIFRPLFPDQPFMPDGHDCMAKGLRVVYREGKEYLLVNGYHTAIVLLRTGNIYVPVAAAGGNSRLVTDDGSGRTIWDSDLRYHMIRDYYPAVFKGHAGDNFSWTDQNGDGRVQPEEMRFVKTLSRGEVYAEGKQPEWMSFWGAGLAPDGSIVYGGFCKDKTATYRLDVQGWTPGGAPIYDIASAKTLFLYDKPDCVSGYYVNAENRIFVTFKFEGGPKGIREDQPNALECRDRDGALLWSVAMPKQLLAKDFHADNVIGEFQIPGVGPVIATWLWHGNLRPYLLTGDGLFLGTMLDETLLGPSAIWGESYKFYFQTPDGTPHLVNGGNDSHHIFAIRGLEGAQRFSVPLTLTPADVQHASEMRATPIAKAAPKPRLNIAWTETPPAVDGALEEWKLEGGVTFAADGGRGAQVALARDKTNLYLAYRVQDATPLLNRGEDWQKLFTTGDCVDLMLAVDPKADPNRRSAAVGDLRLLLGTFQDAPIAVLYRPTVPGTKEPVTLMAARLDEIKRLPTAKVAVRKGEGFYTVEAAVPLQELGVNPAAREALKGDVGVIFSDETGRGRALRLYYYNRQTTIINDLTTEATLQPGEWGPVHCPSGQNLLKNGGFEEGFAKSPEQGWKVEVEANGGVAKLTADGPRSGKQALLLEQTTPVTFPEAAYAFPNWPDFVKAANGGKGGGHVSLCQTVPVTGGKKYIFRLAYRTEDFQLERRNPGKGRGYVAFTPRIFWTIPGKPSHTTGIHNIQGTFPDWQVQTNAFSHELTADTLTAPEGATQALISFKWSVVAADRLPKLWVDDVEMVEDF
jgi:hypothetical protein